MSTLKVDAIRHNSATSDAITTAADGTCTARITSVGGGGLSHRNIIINGAMTVAQRGSSSTTSGYATVDRFAVQFGGTDEAATQAQVDVASGTSPYTNGFRKALKITNGNQTSGAGAADFIRYRIRIEAQDIANSGWNYKSASSFITLSFWIKSSVAKSFKGHFHAVDGTQQGYPFETGSLTADTWTKITKTIPGNSNLTFNNDNALGLEISIYGYIGTDYTDSGVSLNAWAAWSSSTYTTDDTSTWWTTNDATLELTGVQLEVGDTATSFEHRSFGEELLRCQRYYFKFHPDDAGDTDSFCWAGKGAGSSGVDYNFILPCPLRASPTINLDTSGGGNVRATKGTSGNGTSTTNPTVSGFNIHYPFICLRQLGFSGMSDNVVSMVSLSSTGVFIEFTAEL